MLRRHSSSRCCRLRVHPSKAARRGSDCGASAHFLARMLSCAQRSALRHIRAQLHPLQALRPQQSALARLLSSLAILEQREGKLSHASLSAVTAGQKLGGSVTGLVAGSGVKPVAEEAAKVKGIERIIMIENGSYDKACGLLA